MPRWSSRGRGIGDANVAAGPADLLVISAPEWECRRPRLMHSDSVATNRFTADLSGATWPSKACQISFPDAAFRFPRRKIQMVRSFVV